MAYDYNKEVQDRLEEYRDVKQEMDIEKNKNPRDAAIRKIKNELAIEKIKSELKEQKPSLEQLIEKIKKDPSQYPESERMMRHRKFRMDQLKDKQLKSGRSIASEQPEEYPLVEESDQEVMPNEAPDVSEMTESLVQSGVDRSDAEKLASHYLGDKKPSDETDKRYSDIFDILSERYKKLQEAGRVGE